MDTEEEKLVADHGAPTTQFSSIAGFIDRILQMKIASTAVVVCLPEGSETYRPGGHEAQQLTNPSMFVHILSNSLLTYLSYIPAPDMITASRCMGHASV